MIQGIMIFHPKPEKDNLLIHGLRAITLLNVYKRTLIFARCLGKGLSEIINETPKQQELLQQLEGSTLKRLCIIYIPTTYLSHVL